MKPVRIPASATLKLPRWGLLLLLLLYILPGLIGRDPWKSDDAASFGIMWTMAHGSLQDWLIPNIVGLPIPGEGPLAFWLGAICIKLFGWLLGDALAARVANIGFFLLGTSSLWYATYRLGQRAEAQPMQLAFGGQPEPKDYGRMLADGALLIYLGCLGLLLHSHETKAEALLVSLVAVLLYVSVRYMEAPSLRTAGLLGLVLGCLTLTRGWAVPLALWIGLAVCYCWLQLCMRRTALHLLLAMAIAVALSALWLVCASWVSPTGPSLLESWLTWNRAQISFPNIDAIRFFLKNGFLFFWPAWPFAIWSVYAWRKQRHDLHIALPLSFAIALIALVFLDPAANEGTLLPLLPALAVLASFGLPTMRRGAINAVDWFSVMVLTFGAAFVWIGWIAKQTGWPTRLANRAIKLAPGFIPEFSLFSVMVAVLATAAWFLLVYWRLSRQPKVIWRAVVLSSGGVILLWLLLTTLWLPWINYGKSYAGVAQQIAQKLPSLQSCVDTNVTPAQRASFAYLGGITFAAPGMTPCNYVLLFDNPNSKQKSNVPTPLLDTTSQWQLLWEGHRPSDRYERFRLFQRK